MDGGILTGVSLMASFLAGILALFAPCCITFLLPSYFGTIFQEKKKIMYYTIVFAVGLATILVPIALGFRTAIYFLDEYHKAIYYAGAVIMILMGFMTIKPVFHLPSFLQIKPLDKERVSTASVLGLGIMSGITSACCAPVLFAAVTLTSLSPSLLTAVVVALAYVAGIVAPLVIIASAYEKWTAKMAGGNRQKFYKVLTYVGATIFFVTGILIAVFNYMGKIVMDSTDPYAQWIRGAVFSMAKTFSNPFVDVFVFSVIMGLIYSVMKRRMRERISGT